MTEAEVAKRISVSAKTLNAYRQRGRAGVESIPQFRDEMLVLEAIAQDNAGFAGEATELLHQWQEYANLVRLGVC